MFLQGDKDATICWKSTKTEVSWLLSFKYYVSKTSPICFNAHQCWLLGLLRDKLSGAAPQEYYLLETLLPNLLFIIGWSQNKISGKHEYFQGELHSDFCSWDDFSNKDRWLDLLPFFHFFSMFGSCFLLSSKDLFTIPYSLSKKKYGLKDIRFFSSLI